jgi:hypothetical protein
MVVMDKKREEKEAEKNFRAAVVVGVRCYIYWG